MYELSQDSLRQYRLIHHLLHQWTCMTSGSVRPPTSPLWAPPAHGAYHAGFLSMKWEVIPFVLLRVSGTVPLVVIVVFTVAPTFAVNIILRDATISTASLFTSRSATLDW